MYSYIDLKVLMIYFRLSRENLEDITVKGVFIPKMTHIIISVLAMHKNPKYWPNPEKFDPNRYTFTYWKTISLWYLQDFNLWQSLKKLKQRGKAHNVKFLHKSESPKTSTGQLTRSNEIKKRKLKCTKMYEKYALH